MTKVIQESNLNNTKDKKENIEVYETLGSCKTNFYYSLTGNYIYFIDHKKFLININLNNLQRINMFK